MHPLPDDITFRHLARVVESSDDAIVSKDLNGIITSWNRAAERMFGYSAAEAIGQSIRMIIPADRQAEEDMVLGRIRAGQAITHFETIRQRKDGTLVPISLTVSPIYDDAGRVIGASKIARDISDRAQAAVASRRLAAVVESSDDAIITKDLNSIITSWNPAAERMFGYTAAEAIGQSIRMLIPQELQDEEDDVLAKIRAGEKIDHYETVRQRKDGTPAVDFADRLADPERSRRDHRRVEDRPRHHRARASASLQPANTRATPRSWAKSAPSSRRRWIARRSSRKSPTSRRS